MSVKRCECCDGSNVFTCEMCGSGLATKPVYFVDTEEDPNTEHAIWVCSDCKEREKN